MQPTLEIVDWRHPKIVERWYAEEGKYYLIDSIGNVYGPFDSYEKAQELL